MAHPSARRGIVLFALFAAGSRLLSAQTFVGVTGIYHGNVNPSGVTTVIETAGAPAPGWVTNAVFGWSASPCPAAVKIKFFHPVRVFGTLIRYDFLTERGPFDVTQPVQTAIPFLPPVTQPVILDPPVPLQEGDLIAVTNLTACGGPTRAFVPPSSVPFDPALPPALVVPGDVTAAIPQGSLPAESEAIFVLASGASPTLRFLGDRFRVTLLATNPRNGRTAAGVAIPLGNSAGYFSLPEFTGDPTFPEVTVKMVDASRSPALGGGFWFFHAPLTDVQYTLTVLDVTTGAIRIYNNTSGSPDQLCGGVDTSAFPGP